MVSVMLTLSALFMHFSSIVYFDSSISFSFNNIVLQELKHVYKND